MVGLFGWSKNLVSVGLGLLIDIGLGFDSLFSLKLLLYHSKIINIGPSDGDVRYALEVKHQDKYNKLTPQCDTNHFKKFQGILISAYFCN